MHSLARSPLFCTLFPYIPSVHVPIEDEKEVSTDFNVKSRISDIAKLQLNDQYIDDPIIEDMIMLLRLKTGCYCFSPVFWATIRKREILIRDKQGKNKDGQLRHRGNAIFNSPSKDLIFIPINQNNEHWSLGIVDIVMSTVRYYSSTNGGKDAYYTTFKSTIESFLDVQLPGVKFEYGRLEGETQGDNVDCALFTLNKISELGVNYDDRRTYTRKSIATSLLALFLRRLTREGWPFIVEDVVNRYFDQPKDLGKSKLDDAPTAGIWKSITDSKKELKMYKEIYLASLLSLLSDTLKYDAYSLTALKEALLSAVFSKDDDEPDPFEKVTAIFEENLAPKKKKKKKRARSDSNEEKEKRTKASKISVSRRTLETVIGEAIEKKKAYNSFGGIFDYKNDYSAVLTKNLEPFIKDKKDLSDATNEFINALFVSKEMTEESNQAIASVLCKYSIDNNHGGGGEEEEEEEEDVCKLFLTCFYCNAATNQVDLLTQRVYCSTDCRSKGDRE